VELSGSHAIRWYLRLVAVLASLALGCAAEQARMVEEQYVTSPPSYTDEASRRLASGTFQRLPEYYEDYRVGPEDVLEISIFEWELREETKSVEIRVSESGLISLPVIGEMNVRDLTVEEVKSKIEQRLREWQIIPNPRVSVVVQQFRSKRVAVVGAVRDPGTYTLRRNVTTLLDILSLAGGPDDRAGQVAYVIRNIRPRPARPAPEAGESGGSLPGGPGPALLSDSDAVPAEQEVITIDLYEVMELGNLNLNVLVGDGDVVNIPEAKRFQVLGFVKDPGTYSLKKPTSVLEGIAMARGVLQEEASSSKSVLKRKTADGEIMIPLDIPAIAKGEQPNLYLQADDVIVVPQTGLRRTMLYVYNFIRSVWNFGISGRVF
jgi:polysaccharide export outer membrane protein